MNYRHIYHAGNFADVMKHWVLTLLLEKLQEKPTPFGVLDTHAGVGFYDLSSPLAQKTGEFQQGIVKLLAEKTVPDVFASYLNLIRDCQIDATRLHYYPGSPYIMEQFLREHDQLIACELHPEEYALLKRNMHTDSAQLALHQQDGYHAMKAFLPFKQKRGLILIDPPFEQPNEFHHITQALTLATQRFAHGMYAVWFPIKHRPPIRAFYTAVQQLGLDKVLAAELLIRDDNNSDTLNGCGLLLINPPWHLDTTLRTHLPYLAELFQQGSGARAQVEWV